MVFDYFEKTKEIVKKINLSLILKFLKKNILYPEPESIDIKSMIYIAIIFIALGIACFVYASSITNGDEIEQPKKPKEQVEMNKNTQKTRISNRFSSTPSITSNEKPFRSEIKRKIFNSRYPHTKNSREIDEFIRLSRAYTEQSKSTPKKEEIHTNSEDDLDSALDAEKLEAISPISPVEEEISSIEAVSPEPRFSPPISPEPISEVETVSLTQPLESEKESPKPPRNPFQLQGILYLDFSRRIPLQDRRLKDLNWTESTFQHLKRIGKIRMLEIEGQIEFHGEREVHEFYLEDLDQIVFYDSAFSLLPLNPSLPSSLVFSEESARFKKALANKLKSNN